MAGAGIQSAALSFGGGSPGANTESYNGTSWSEINDLNTGRAQLAGCGTQTAALAIAGGFPIQAVVESWNGSVWTEVGDVNTARRILAGTGTSTSALAFGGLYTTPNSSNRILEWFKLD
jgi:hypothetical protein